MKDYIKDLIGHMRPMSRAEELSAILFVLMVFIFVFWATWGITTTLWSWLQYLLRI